jgi:hypothetical protein
MINSVNSWDLINYNWSIDTRNSSMKINQEKQHRESHYIFDYRDEPYRHVYGGKWTLFSEYVPPSRISTWT